MNTLRRSRRTPGPSIKKLLKANKRGKMILSQGERSAKTLAPIREKREQKRNSSKKRPRHYKILRIT